MKHTYICPNCHGKVILKDNIHKIRLKRVNWKKCDVLCRDITLKDEIYNVFCLNCGTRMFHVDNDIADIIVALNDAGLKTKFSCSGHTKRITDLITKQTNLFYPYITFDPSANKLLRQIPIDFYHRCIEKYNLINFNQIEITELIKGNKIIKPCFRISFKHEYKEVKRVDGTIDRILVDGREHFSECLEQMKRFSKDLIEEIGIIYRNNSQAKGDI